MKNVETDPMCQVTAQNQAIPNTVSSPLNTSNTTVEPADIARSWNMKAQRANGQIEWHGPNPTGAGATKDGFILKADGRAWDRSMNRLYKSPEVAELYGISPEQYGPYARWKAQNTSASLFNSSNSFNSSSSGHDMEDDFTWRREDTRKPQVNAKQPVSKPSGEMPFFDQTFD